MHMINRKRLRLAIRHMIADRQDFLDEKAELAKVIAKYAEDELVAIVVWQMDCDCSSWTSKIVVQATVTHVNKVLADVYDGAEGPVRWHIDRPSVVVQRNSRDHALEAHEDGHAYSVSY